MRHVLGLIVASCVLQAVGAQEQPAPYQAITTANDVLADALWRIARATDTRIGFEATDHIKLPRLLNGIPMLPVSALDDSLNAAVAADQRYEWRKVHDVVVVRPKRAWADPADPFNRPMRNVQISNATPRAVLLGLRDFIYTDKFAVDPRPAQETLVSFQVQSGTVIDVLNELMIAADHMMWVGSYRPLGQPAERLPNWDLCLEVRVATHFTALSCSYPPKRK
jgi:hypothetical protein